MLRTITVIALVGGSFLAQARADSAQTGFKGYVRSVDVPRNTVLVNAEIPGYGPSTDAYFGVESVEDENGRPVPLKDLERGDRVRIDYSGGFLESLPLQGGKARFTILVPTEEGRITHIDRRGFAGTRIVIGEGREALIVQITGSTVLPDRPLRVGDEIIVKYDGRVLESLPPQINALQILFKRTRPARPSMPGFEGVVLNVHQRNGKVSLHLEARIEGYGTTQVFAGVQDAADSNGQPIDPRGIAAGTHVFVEYDGGYLESYPLQLERPVRVVVK